MSMDERRAAEERLAGMIDGRQANCAVIGLGFIGSILMDALAHAGFRAYGFDRSADAGRRFEAEMGQKHSDARGGWAAGSDPEPIADAHVVMVAVRALPRSDETVDLEPLESAASILSARGSEPRLVMLESTVPCGVTRCFAARLAARPGLFVAHSPERLSVGHDREVLRRVPHLVGGMDEAAGRLGARLLRTICDQVVSVSSPEVSELSKLLENAFLTTGIALSNEFTRVAHSVGIAAEEVCAAAATKPFGYYPFHPGPGLGGHCLGNDLAILLSSQRRFGVSMPMMTAVAKAAAEGPDTVLRRFEEILRARGRLLRSLRVLLVGVGFKPGTADTTGSPARDIARLLRQRGAEVSYLDSLVPEFLLDGQALDRVGEAYLQPGSMDAAIVVSGDRAITIDRLAACSDLVFDARGRRDETRPGSVHTL
jgi:UDP-N-acetyl-D-glucosamine dehydrogenase